MKTEKTTTKPDELTAPEAVELLLSPCAFVRAVVAASASTATYRQAYEQVETRLETVTGRRHYADYSVFRVAKHRVQKITVGPDRNQLTIFSVK